MKGDSANAAGGNGPARKKSEVPDIVQMRKDWLLMELIRNVDKTLTFDWLNDRLHAMMQSRLPNPTLRNDFVDIRALGIPDFHLRIESDAVELTRTKQNTYTQRKQKNYLEKLQIGAALWQGLFNVQLLGKMPNINYEYTAAVKNKLEMLRKKYNLLMMIDAGTTTNAAIELLVEAKHMPLRCTFNEDDTDAIRLVRPNLVTNSPPINEVIKRSRHRDDIPVILIGGESRASHDSICGTHSELCLEAWRMRTDIAIVGATGYTLADDGMHSFGCDGIHEARLKAEMLRMATLRILIFDSSKLLRPEVNNIFTPLEKSTIDIIICDDGVEIERRRKLRAEKEPKQRGKKDLPNGSDSENIISSSDIQERIHQLQQDAKSAGVAVWTVAT